MRLPRHAGAVATVLVALALLAAAFLYFRPRPADVSLRAAVLTRQNAELVKLAAAAEKGTLLDFKGMLIVVDQVLVQDLLRAATPLEADVGGGFHLRIDAADAAFGDGVALVHMTGTASVGGVSVGSPVKVFGAIDVVDLDPASGVLRCNLSVLGVEAEDARALGYRDPVGRLTEALTHGGLETLLGPIEIPVSLEDNLSIPALDSKRLQIAAEDLPLTVAVHEVKVFGGRLWIFVDVALAARSEKPAAKS